jgi:hypothetical protein
MKRLPFLVALLLAATTAFAFNPTPRATQPRIGVLRVSQEYERGADYVAKSVVRFLREELREQGVDAYDTGLTYEEVADGKGEDADYYIEIFGADADSGSYGGLDVGTYDVGVSVDVIVSHVAAEVRVYDGRTGELVRSEPLSKKKTAVMPTSVYVGGRSRLFAAIALPFVQHAQYKNITRSAARDAAQVVIETVQPGK